MGRESPVVRAQEARVPTGNAGEVPAVTVRGLTKRFPDAVVYDRFDLDIPRGKLVSIFGPNGCGKSTLINMITGLIPIDAGEILFDGKPLRDTKFGYVFQNYREALRSEEHTSELQSRVDLVCRLLLSCDLLDLHSFPTRRSSDLFDLDIPRGKLVSIFGPNGCGKSTLINMITGLIPIDAGEILFDGKPLRDTKFGYVFQNYREALFPWLRAIDNIDYPLKLMKLPKAERRTRTER